MDSASIVLEREQFTQDDWAISAEAGLIGAIMFKSDWFERLSVVPDPDDFLSPAHGELWREIMVLRSEGHSCDGVALRRIVTALPQYFQEEYAKGPAYLAYLLECCAFWPECDDYARIVVDRSNRRKIQVTAAGLINDLESVRHAPEAIDRLKATLEPLEAAIAKTVNDGSMDPSEVFKVTPQNSLFKTGITRLDNEFRGFQRGLMSVVGGAPAMGKTALIIQMMVNAVRRGESVGMFTLDMTSQQVWQRVGTCIAFEDQLLPVGQIPTFGDFFDKPLRPEQHEALEKGLRSARNILVSEASRMTPEDIERQVMAWQLMLKREGRPQLSAIFVDHMGQVEPGVKTGDAYNKMSGASSKLLAMAKRLRGLATIVVVQVNRRGRQENRRPMAHDLRDSGRIEEDANAIVLVHRQEWYLEQQLKDADVEKEESVRRELEACQGNMDIVVGKNRISAPGVVILDHMIQYNQIAPGAK